MGQGPELLISQRINFDRFAYLQESLIHVGLQAPDPKSPDSAAYSHPTGFWKLHTFIQNLKPPTVIQQASESYKLFKGCPAFDI